jgi:hypothetical protein
MTIAQKLQSTLAKLDEDIGLLAEDVAETAALLQDGKVSSEDLDAAIARKAQAEARRQAFIDLQERAKSTDQKAVEVATNKAKIDAASKALTLLPQIEKVSADIESRINSMFALIDTLGSLHEQVRGHGYDAGWKDTNRLSLTNLDAVGSYLAHRLNVTGVGNQLQAITTSGTQYMAKDASLVDLVKKRNVGITRNINLVLAK